MSSQHTSDQGAAFKGLIVTAFLLFAMAFGIVKWTNAKYASHGAAKAGATAKP